MITDQERKAPEGRPISAVVWPDQRWRIAAASIFTFVLGAASAVSPTVAVISLAIFITVIAGWWALMRGDALVVAVALLVFWAPFHTTISQFNISPQEVGVYFVLLGCLLLERRSMWRWAGSFFTSVPRISLIAVAVFTLACLQSVALEKGMGILGRVQALRSELLYPILFALLVTYTVRTRRVDRVIIQLFFGGAVTLAAYALTLKLWGVDIANGAVAGRLGAEASFLSQYHPNNLGLYMAMALPFALPLWSEAATSRTFVRLKQAGIVVSVILLTVDIVLAASRGTFVALAVSALVAVVFVLWLGTPTQRAIVGSVAFGAIAGVVALILGRQTAAFGRYAALLDPVSLWNNSNVQFRISLYRRAYDLIKGRPFTGIGLQAFASTGSTPFSPHDTYLDLWVSIGLFGLLAFVFVLAHGVWSSIAWARYHKQVNNQAGVFYSMGIILGLVTFTAQAFVEAYDAQPRIAPIIWMLALVAQVAVFKPVILRRTGAPARPVPPVWPAPESGPPERGPSRGVRPTPRIAPPPDEWIAWPSSSGGHPMPAPVSQPRPAPGDGPLQAATPPTRSTYPPSPQAEEPGQGDVMALDADPTGVETAPSATPTHPPLPEPETPFTRLSGGPALAEPANRSWAVGRRRLTDPMAVNAPTVPREESRPVIEEVDPQWDWDLHTGPLVMMADVTLPLIQESAFSNSNIIEAGAFQRDARRAAASAAAAAPEAPVESPGVAQGPVGLSDDSRVFKTPQSATDHVEALLKRAPGGYIWNQIYSILIFGLSFVLSVIIARGLRSADFGVYTVLSSIVSVLALLVAFGLEDAATVFVPRLLATGGRSGAARLLRQMLLLRVVAMLVIGALLVIGLPLVAGPMQVAGIAPAGFTQAVSGFAGLRAALMGAYLAGSAIVALQGAFFASVLKTRATLVIGGVSQTLGAGLTLALLWLGYGIDGVFAAQAAAAAAAAIAFLIVLWPYLFVRANGRGLEDGQTRSLMASAWLTNISNGALGKQMDIMLMSFFAVSYAAIGFYNLAYQLVTIIGVLLISGLGGVSVAAMSVAYSARGPGRLISMWRAIIMLQLLLVIPLQTLTFLLADQIIASVYGAQYAPAAALLRIFLVFSFLGRLLGGGANQSALYVINRQRVVLITRWTGFVINLALDIILIHLAGPAGALVATGFSQLWVGAVEYLVLRRELKNRYPMSMAIRVLTYSLVAAIPIAALALPGLTGLVARGALFVVIFVVAALAFRLGDTRDIVELAALNPRIQWVINLVSRISVPGVLRNRQVV